MPAVFRCERPGPVRTSRTALGLLLVTLAAPVAGEIPTPEAHFGFAMGADRRLASADAIEQYFEIVAAGSDRVRLIDIGPTTEGRRTVAALISASGNIRRLDQIQATNRRLADPRTVSPDEAERMAARQPAVVVVGGGIHASEIGASQAANELLYLLATGETPRTVEALENVVLILIPSLNPDGHRLVVDWYERHTGTPFEGGPMPWLYHEYAGHDLNRDAFMMNLAESRNLARFFYTEWHPQVFLTVHQMGTTGPRFFVPPNTDPIDANYDPLIWRTAALLGGAMGFELQRDGRKGVVSNAMYDYYWPGYEDSAPLGHNTVCLLAEVASANVATPVTIAAGDLQGGQRGLLEYQRQINFPDPWPGGTWRLRDIVEYELSAVNGLLYAVSVYRGQIVQNFYEMGRRAVEAGSRGGPFAFIIPPEQHDVHASTKLRQLLLQGQIEIHRALEPFRADGDPYPEGSDIILLAQPFRAYVKTLLERQRYPVQREAPGGAPHRPYDAAGWTLPAQMGVDVRTIERYFEVPAMARLTSATILPGAVWGERRPDFYVIDAPGNGGAIAANRLSAAGAQPEWLTAPLVAGGFHYPRGSLLVRHSSATESNVAGLATELGLRVDGVRGRRPAGTLAVGGARIGLYKSWVANIDEGWTRWLLETYEFGFTSLTDADIRAGDLRTRFDAIVLPSAQPEGLLTGHAAEVMPPEYAGGLGEAGRAALEVFVREGGMLICLDEACDLALGAWRLPVREVARAAGDSLFCPGSLVRIELDESHPLAFGLPATTAGFFSFSSAYELRGPQLDGGRTSGETVARYATTDLLVSGWLEGGEILAGQGAIVQVPLGAGRVVLLGFRVQHRGQSHATFRLLFNALLTSARARP